jgi:hypothetical protein
VTPQRSGNSDYRLDRIEEHGNRVVASFSWVDKSGRRHEWAHMIEIRNGRIVDMQDYRSHRHATATARLRAALSS